MQPRLLKWPKRQQPFGVIANFIVKSSLYFARNFILAETSRLRSSQPRQAAKRYAPLQKNRLTEIMEFTFNQIIYLIILIIWVFVVLKVMLFHFITIKSWNKTRGTITNSDVKWFRSKTDSDTEGWKEMVRYKYYVNSIEYENNIISKNLSFISSSKSFAVNYDFKIGQNVEVTYNPVNPKDSVLTTKFNYLIIICPVIIFTFIYYILFISNEA